MNIEIDIIKPTYVKKPNYVSTDGIGKAKGAFDCCDCQSKIDINYKNQINHFYQTHSNSINSKEYLYLINFYKININGKSHDGGFPVFEKLSCKKCNSQFIVYYGVSEVNNSVYTVQQLGLLKIK